MESVEEEGGSLFETEGCHLMLPRGATAVAAELCLSVLVPSGVALGTCSFTSPRLDLQEEYNRNADFINML